MHTSMFSQGHSRGEVREGMKGHQRRDRTIVTVLDLFAAGCLIYLLRDWAALDKTAALVGAAALLIGLRYFIDMSNRNFYLHRLDWEDETSEDIP